MKFGDFMKLKIVHTFMNVSRILFIILALITGICYFMKIKAGFIIGIGLMILTIVVYFTMALVFWRCPHCHQYLPLKDTKDLLVCPHCQKPLRDE